ncbi:hypothetical protein KSS87_001481 [Heliosperma pusillum]|nr:hypothetical protein KSS87_001481 [Heliosperma pusillum]
MEGKYNKVILIVGILAFVVSIGKVDSSGECGKTSPDMEAFKLAPCASAVQDGNAPVSSDCCAAADKIAQNPACLCAVLMSNMAKMSGVKPQIALTVPKRCNMPNRPAGYKCGPDLNAVCIVAGTGFDNAGMILRDRDMSSKKPKFRALC